MIHFKVAFQVSKRSQLVHNVRRLYWKNKHSDFIAKSAWQTHTDTQWLTGKQAALVCVLADGFRRQGDSKSIRDAPPRLAPPRAVRRSCHRQLCHCPSRRHSRQARCSPLLCSGWMAVQPPGLVGSGGSGEPKAAIYGLAPKAFQRTMSKICKSNPNP